MKIEDFRVSGNTIEQILKDMDINELVKLKKLVDEIYTDRTFCKFMEEQK